MQERREATARPVDQQGQPPASRKRLDGESHEARNGEAAAEAERANWLQAQAEGRFLPSALCQGETASDGASTKGTLSLSASAFASSENLRGPVEES